MKTRDVATIAFRLLALWITISALTALIDLLFNWKTVAGQMMGSFSGVANAPTERELFWMTASALVGRGIIGLVAWWLSPLLARVTFASDARSVVGDRDGLYAAASFLVGLCLIAISAPGLAFEAYVATKPGFPAYPEGHPRVPLLLAQFVLGVSFVWNRWLVRLATGQPRSEVSAGAPDGAVQQRDEADEARDG
jgi:hypothetical protein